MNCSKLPWAYLHRNLNGKYRVSPLLGDCTEFEYLKKTRDVVLPNGVFIYLGRPILVPFVFSDPEVFDILVPNGNFRSGTFEALSYITNDVVRSNGSPWLDPPGRLPPSETEGRTALEQVGNTFANLPPKLVGYIPRTTLETRLHEELRRTDRHPIVSLTGPGGIGKTTLAIAAIEAIANLQPSPYDVVVWLSARDIDLLDSGPKPVAPRVVKKEDIARAAVELLEPSERGNPGFNPETYMQTCFAKGAAHEKETAWVRLADLCHSTDDAVGEVHALAEAALLPMVRPEDIGAFANRINNRICDLRGRRVDDAWSPEIRLLIERVAAAMEKHIRKLSATDCSRLAWLYLNTGNDARARDIAETGIQRDQGNEHCQNLIRRLRA